MNKSARIEMLLAKEGDLFTDAQAEAFVEATMRHEQEPVHQEWRTQSRSLMGE